MSLEILLCGDRFLAVHKRRDISQRREVKAFLKNNLCYLGKITENPQTNVGVERSAFPQTAPDSRRQSHLILVHLYMSLGNVNPPNSCCCT